MSNLNPYATTADQALAAAFADESARAGFIRRTYLHLTGAVLALIALEAVLFAAVPAATMQALVIKMTGGYGWLIVLGAFMGASWIATAWANSGTSRGMQYAGLGLYVIAEAVILLPLLYICIRILQEPRLPIMAAVITAASFAGLTAFVFTTRIDLASWGKYLGLAGIIAMVAIVASICFGFSLGIWFAAAIVALACGTILYQTSNILHHYNTSQDVAASLALFASVVLLFYYVLRIMMMFASED